MKMTILVCGSRDFSDHLKMHRILSRHLQDEVTLISGMAPGADTIAVEIAHSFGWGVIECFANWNLYGRAAGVIRNQQMVDLLPDQVYAFPGNGPGTYDCIKRAREAKLNVEVF